MILLLTIFSALTFIYSTLVLVFSLNNKYDNTTGKLCESTIIIAARNEELVIDACLCALSSQNFPNRLLEILVVDDNSTDLTSEIIEKWVKKDSRIVMLKTPKERKYRAKKAPLDFAIRQARGDIILVTDADCVQKPNWAKTMVQSFKPNTIALSGFAVIKRGKSAVNIFQRLDFMLLMMANRGMADAGFGLAGCGMNLAFRKNAFFSANGFEKIKNMLGGDDTILLQEMKKTTGGKIHFAHSPETFVKTESQSTWRNLFRQRLRWAVDGLYQFRQNPVFFILLLVMTSAHFCGVMLPMFIIFKQNVYWGFISILVLKIIADLGVFRLCRLWFGEPVSVREFIIWWLINPIYYIITTVLSPFGNIVRWK